MLELGNLSAPRHQEIGELIATLCPRPDLVVAVGPEANLITTETERVGIETHRFAESETAAAFLRENVDKYQSPQLVLVKGSRGIRLEEVTRSLVEA
jgi:UDP-N-acetylmuramyl pentapeptide synthase